MKSLSKKAIVISIATLITVPSVAIAGWNYTHPAPAPLDNQAVAAQEVTPQTAQTSKESTPTEEITPAPTPTPTVVTPTPAPVILTTQQYAEMYLDLTTYDAQGCLDRIIAAWPDRFTPEVREQNIKALRVWASLCATGMIKDRPVDRTLINSYGPNGGFFDSPLANAYH